MYPRTFDETARARLDVVSSSARRGLCPGERLRWGERRHRGGPARLAVGGGALLARSRFRALSTRLPAAAAHTSAAAAAAVACATARATTSTAADRQACRAAAPAAAAAAKLAAARSSRATAV